MLRHFAARFYRPKLEGMRKLGIVAGCIGVHAEEPAL